MKTRNVRWIAYLGMAALLANLILGLLGFSNQTQEIENIKNRLLKNQLQNNIDLTMKYVNNTYGTLKQGEGTLLDSEGISIEGRFGLVDSILEDLGEKSSIFVKENNDFKRITTNIMGDDNERAVGTYLGQDHMAYHTVLNGQTYIGEANILGENYYTAYKPITDVNNNVIGLLFVGTPTEELDKLIEVHDTEMERINTLIIVLRAVSLGSLIVLVGLSVADTNDREKEKKKAA